MKISKLMFANAILLLGGAANADILWQDLNVTYLKGSNYRVGDADRQVYTLEHVAGTSWGDSFMSTTICAATMATGTITANGHYTPCSV
jgi:hypothetical protein